MWLKKITFETDTSGNPQGIGKIGFENLNFFEVTWSDPNLKLYWLPADGQSISSACSGSADDADKACEFTYSGWCAIRIGKFVESGHITTGVRDEKNWDMDLTFANDQQKACAQQMNTVAAVGSCVFDQIYLFFGLMSDFINFLAQGGR